MVGRPAKGVRRYICIRSGRNHLGIAAEPVEHYVGDMATLTVVRRTVVRDPAELSAPLQAELDAVEDKLAAWARNAAAAGLAPEEIIAGREPLAAERDRLVAELESIADEPEEPSILVTRDQGSADYSPEFAAMIASRVESVTVSPVGRGGGRVPVADRLSIKWRDGVEVGTNPATGEPWENVPA
jgi:hypothetical protein